MKTALLLGVRVSVGGEEGSGKGRGASGLVLRGRCEGQRPRRGLGVIQETG